MSSQTCLKRSDVLQIVDVKENGDPWKEQAELSLNACALVLACAPDVDPARSTQRWWSDCVEFNGVEQWQGGTLCAQEHMPLVALCKSKIGHSLSGL